MTPTELDKRDFKRAVRGYSEEEVDYYLNAVRTDYETLYKENQEIQAKLDDYEQNVGKYKALEQTLNNTLIVAQQTAEDLKRNAEKAAELILEEAKLKAQQRVHAAEAEVRKLGLQKEELLKRIQEVKIRLRAFLRAQLDLLEDNKELDEVVKSEQDGIDLISTAEVNVAQTEVSAGAAATEDNNTPSAQTNEAPVDEAPTQEISEEVTPAETSTTEVTEDENKPINYSWTRGDE